MSQDLDWAKHKDWLDRSTDVTKPCRDADHPGCITRQWTDLKGAFRNWIWKTGSHFLILEEITFGLTVFVSVEEKNKQFCAYKGLPQKWLWNRTAQWCVSSLQIVCPGWEIKASSTESSKVFNFNSKYKWWPHTLIYFITFIYFIYLILSGISRKHTPQLSSVQCLWNFQSVFTFTWILGLWPGVWTV